MENILLKVFYILVFPGFVFCFISGLLLCGIDRKIVAHMQKRIGPPILQPFYDFFKLLGKETIIPKAASKSIFIAAPIIGLSASMIMALFIPVFGFSAFTGVADIVVIIYLLILPEVAVILGGSASGSCYAGVGISRQMVLMIACELPLVMVLLSVALRAGGGNMAFSFATIYEYQKNSGSMLFDWRMIPAALAMLMIIPCEIGAKPFDIAEAETEICEGPLVEYGGRLLALYKLSHAVKALIVTWLFASLFLAGIGTGIIALDTAILLALCIVITVVCVSLLKAVTARLKIEKVFKFYWSIPSALALASLIIVWIGI